jgi:rubrerythrin
MNPKDVLREMEHQIANYRSWRESLGVQFTKTDDQVRECLIARHSEILARSEESTRNYLSRRVRMGLSEVDSEENSRLGFARREIESLVASERHRDLMEYRQEMAKRFAFGYICVECGEEWWTDIGKQMCPKCGNPSRIIALRASPCELEITQESVSARPRGVYPGAVGSA